VPPVSLRVSQEGDAVILEWQNGRQGPYIVRQAASAREVREAPGVQVRGHRYVDRSASDGRMVYYLVE
jgi:hypothetical protein